MSRFWMIAPLAAAVWFLPGCGRQPVRVVDVSETRVVERTLTLGSDIVERFGTGKPRSDKSGRRGDDPAGSQGKGGPGAGGLPPLGWKLPPGWKEKPKSQFRMGSFSSPGNGDCSVSVVGGDLTDNVNRWLGQFGQPALDPVGVQALEKRPVLSGKINGYLVECSGPYTSMRGEKIASAALLGIVIPVGPTVSMFVKFVGPVDTVAAERENFFLLCDSLFFESKAPAANAPKAPEPRTRLSWSIPEGWDEVPNASRYRTVTVSPKGNPAVQCWIVQLPGSAGGVENNVNRWLGEIGQPYVGPTAVAALPRLKVLGRDSALIEAYGNYKGQNGSSEDAGLIGVVCENGANTIFIKMVGPSDAVRTEKSRFTEFCASLEAR